MVAGSNVVTQRKWSAINRFIRQQRRLRRMNGLGNGRIISAGLRDWATMARERWSSCSSGSRCKKFRDLLGEK